MSELLQDTIETPGFKPDEMLTCPKCARTSPPTRLKCVYCGADLPVSETQAQNLRPGLRKLESWEKGFNVVYVPGSSIAEDGIAKAAAILKLESSELKNILGKNSALPLTRSESEAEAAIVAQQIKAIGIESKIISDETLKTDAVTPRLRGIDFYDGRFAVRLFNTDELISFGNAEIALIVTGYIFEKKIETEEALRAKKGNKAQDIFEMSSDEPLIDIFTKGHPLGFRIETTGFDFSCLGAEKGLLAKDNIKKLADKFREIAPDAVFLDSYPGSRAEIGVVWGVGEHNDSGGIQKIGMGTLKRKTTVTVSNIDQFTRYSRMNFQLL